MKKISIALFILAAAGISFLFFRERYAPEEQEETLHSRIVTPVAQNTVAEEDVEQTTRFEENTMVTFVPLQLGETLLRTYPVKFSDSKATDELEDQVCAVHRIGNPNIILVVATYNFETAAYERSLEIETSIQQVNTLLISDMDILGIHRNALVYTGFTTNQTTILQVYQSEVSGPHITWTEIASLQSEGTITVQETTRPDSYNLGQTAGEPYTIVENRPLNQRSGNVLDQMQVVYAYNPRSNTFTQESEKLVTGHSVNRQEINRILDGKAETFKAFLDGLWYKTVNTDGESRYLYFDMDKNEIICFSTETQEVYTTDSDWMRRSGISFTSSNNTASTVNRRFDVTLLDVDEVRVKTTDEVYMVINEESVWDGSYKKHPDVKVSQLAPIGAPAVFEKLQTSQRKWHTHDGSVVSFNGSAWSVEKDGVVTGGAYIIDVVQGQTVIEFRSPGNKAQARFKGYYRVLDANDGNSRTEEITLQAVFITMAGITPSGESVRLEREAL